MRWEEQVQSRLADEFVPGVSVEDITTGIEKARAELDSAPAAALPELVERLVRIRLHAMSGVRSRGGPTALPDPAGPQLRMGRTVVPSPTGLVAPRGGHVNSAGAPDEGGGNGGRR